MEEIEKLWKEFDDLEAYDTTLFSNKMNICDKIIELTNYNEERRHQIELENDLLLLGLVNYDFIERLDEIDGPRFEEAICQFIKKNQLYGHYYKKRFSETKNKFDKWRYGLICWFYERSSSYYLEATIKLLLDCTKICVKRDLEYEGIKLLIYAYSLSSLYNLNRQFSKDIPLRFEL